MKAETMQLGFEQQEYRIPGRAHGNTGPGCSQKHVSLPPAILGSAHFLIRK